ncbi:MAG TPA: hypothetical protein VMR74_07100 [Gammaproteobacteria bacterium]|nr:hypothetical protein [Gammaproteobacteria bacterium]
MRRELRDTLDLAAAVGRDPVQAELRRARQAREDHVPAVKAPDGRKMLFRSRARQWLRSFEGDVVHPEAKIPEAADAVDELPAVGREARPQVAVRLVEARTFD